MDEEEIKHFNNLKERAQKLLEKKAKIEQSLEDLKRSYKDVKKDLEALITLLATEEY